MLERDIGHVRAIVDSAHKILRYTEHLNTAAGLYADEKSLDAVLMNFVVIGESASKLSSQSIKDLPDIPWKSIKRFRNIIAHDYFGIDPEAVWQIIQSHLPQLIFHLGNRINSYEEE